MPHFIALASIALFAAVMVIFHQSFLNSPEEIERHVEELRSRCPMLCDQHGAKYVGVGRDPDGFAVMYSCKCYDSERDTPIELGQGIIPK